MNLIAIEKIKKDDFIQSLEDLIKKEKSDASHIMMFGKKSKMKNIASIFLEKDKNMSIYKAPERIGSIYLDYSMYIFCSNYQYTLIGSDKIEDENVYIILN